MCFAILGMLAVPSMKLLRCRAISSALVSRVFVDQAARETLSATLIPSTAAGGTDGERWTR
jgi:hypothetical protein